eukprot:ctg_172.g94
MGMATAAQAADMSSPQGSPHHEYLSGDGGGSSRSLDSLPTQIPSSGMKGGLLRRTPRRDPSIYQVAQVGLETELPRGFSFHPASPRTNGRPARESEQRCELFFASDASAIVEHTRQVVVLEDSDVVHVDSDGEVDVFSFMDEGVQRAVTQTRALITLDFELEQIMRGNFDHFMLKEIFEQPDSLVSTMRGRFQASTRTVHLGGLRERLADILRSSRLIFVGCGTSYNAALACRHLMEQLTELPVAVELASDFLDRRCPIFRSDVCFFLSQSGETADTLDALRYAKQRNALTVGVVNVVGSAIARLTDCVHFADCGDGHDRSAAQRRPSEQGGAAGGDHGRSGAPARAGATGAADGRCAAGYRLYPAVPRHLDSAVRSRLSLRHLFGGGAEDQRGQLRAHRGHTRRRAEARPAGVGRRGDADRIVRHARRLLRQGEECVAARRRRVSARRGEHGAGGAAGGGLSASGAGHHSHATDCVPYGGGARVERGSAAEPGQVGHGAVEALGKRME